MTAIVTDSLSTEPLAPTSPLRREASDFADLYEAHSRAIYYLCLRMLCDPEKAQDATHDTFLKAWRHWGQFEGRASWRTWLYRIAINHCCNLRRSWAERHLVSTDDNHILQDTMTDTSSPLRVIEIEELGVRIERTLDQIPDEYRLLLLLVANEELSYAEVGALTEQSADAVRGKLYRARKAFIAAFPKTA